ncbi:MAG: hypothetical protein WAV05_09495 [Anaerolineales bacterium]
MENKLNTTEQRAVQYWFEDGLAELLGAAICVLLAIYFGVQQILPQSSFAILFLLVFVAAFGIRKLMYSIRQHSTYLRTGYVEVGKGLKDRRLIGVAIGFSVLLLGFILYAILRGIQTITWMAAIGGAIYAFIFFLAAFRTRLLRIYFLAAFSLLLGLVLSVNGLGDFWGAAILSLTIGMVLIAFGIVTRLTYLHQSRPNTEQEDES